MCIKEDPMKEYRWHGHTYQIADEDLENYPGAVPVKAEKEAPKNKARKSAANKSKDKEK